MSKLYLVSLNKDTWVVGEAEEKGKYMETGCHNICCQDAIVPWKGTADNYYYKLDIFNIVTHSIAYTGT